MATKKADKNNGKLSLYPLKFEEAAKDIVKVKPVSKSLRNDGKKDART